MSELMAVASDVSGSIFRQAEWTQDFSKTYMRVFEKIVELEFTGNPEILQILGNLGG